MLAVTTLSSGAPRPDGWTAATHGVRARPGYDEVFAPGRVPRLDLTIAASDWRAQLDDATAGPRHDALRDEAALAPRPPIVVPCRVDFEGRSWHHVGVRFEPDAVLVDGWSEPVLKPSLHLDFDELEGRHPQAHGQHFFGFGRLFLASGSADPSFLDEKVIGDLLREAGIPAGRTAFVRLYLDHGRGPSYFGLYTMVEVPDRPRLWRACGESFGSCRRRRDAGWSDVAAVVEALLRAAGPGRAGWHARLEAEIDVDVILRWVAFDTILQGWDAYGVVTCNRNPCLRSVDRGRFRRAPGGGPALGGTRDPWWPLVRLVLEDAGYRRRCRQHLEGILARVFAPAALEARLRAEHSLVEPYVVGAEGEVSGHTFVRCAEDLFDALEGPDSLLEDLRHRAAGVTAVLREPPRRPSRTGGKRLKSGSALRTREGMGSPPSAPR